MVENNSWKAPQTITEMLRRNVADFPDREALVAFSDQSESIVRLTWSELDRKTDHLASGFNQSGIKKQSKIAFLHNNRAECIYAYLAAHKIGAIFIPINTRLVAREVEYILSSSEADHIIAGIDFISIVEKCKNKLKKNGKAICIEKGNAVPPKWAISFNSLFDLGDSLPRITISSNDHADLIYTSGTTGKPKGVILTHANKIANGSMAGLAMELFRSRYINNRFQNPFPFYTSATVSTVMMSWLYYGHTLIFEQGFDVLETLRTIEKEKSTYYAAAPSMFIFILNHPQLNAFDTTSINAFLFGGAAMPEEIIIKLFQKWPGARAFNLYGLTEAGPGGTVLKLVRSDYSKISSIGMPWRPDQEMRIVDNDGRDLGPEEVGEIIIKGPNVMKQYYKNPTATAVTLCNGWLRTGDMGCYDEQGYFYYKDRKKDLIIRGGFNVYPAEVESVIYEHPDVKQCAVVGKPHEKLGEDLVAFVVPKQGSRFTPDTIVDFCSDKLADFKRPRDIRIVDELPVSAAGKLDKIRLRKLIATHS